MLSCKHDPKILLTASQSPSRSLLVWFRFRKEKCRPADRGLGWVCLFLSQSLPEEMQPPNHAVPSPVAGNRWAQYGPHPATLSSAPPGTGTGPTQQLQPGMLWGPSPSGGCHRGWPPEPKPAATKLWVLGKARAHPTRPPPHLRALPRASRAESTPEDRGLRVLLRQRGMRRRMLGWETRDAPLSHPSTFSANTALPRERPRFGTMLPGSAASARAREHPEPVGRCRAHRGKKLRPHSCESKPYRREGAVLPWRKGSS